MQQFMKVSSCNRIPATLSASLSASPKSDTCSGSLAGGYWGDLGFTTEAQLCLTQQV